MVKGNKAEMPARLHGMRDGSCGKGSQYPFSASPSMRVDMPFD